MENSKNQIMVVEDKEYIRNFLEVALKTEGYEIVSFTNCDTAKNYINDISNEDMPDVVLTDINTPYGNGIELGKYLSDVHSHRNIIFMTGDSEDYVKNNFPNHPVLSKPIPIQRLYDTIDELLKEDVEEDDYVEIREDGSSVHVNPEYAKDDFFIREETNY
ncbi:MAG: response regulator [Nanobdellota archaeon]